VSFVR